MKSRYLPPTLSLVTIGGVSSLLAASPASAAVLPITSVTGTPPFTFPGPDVQVETTLTTLTTSEGTFTNLLGASASLVTGSFYFFLDVDPGSNDAALSGLSLTTSVPNAGDNADLFIPGSNTGMTFFAFELGSKDNFVLQPIDSLGLPIGDLSLEITTGDLGPNVITAGPYNRSDNPNATGSAASVTGVTFMLDDFSGTGDLSDFAGFQYSDPSGTNTADPVLFGAIVPEPASLALLAVGSLCLLRRGRSV